MGVGCMENHPGEHYRQIFQEHYRQIFQEVLHMQDVSENDILWEDDGEE